MWKLILTAVAAYLEARPEAKGDPHAASARVAEMIASAVAIDPEWFWKGVKGPAP